jgi:hypothetical protein
VQPDHAQPFLIREQAVKFPTMDFSYNHTTSYNPLAPYKAIANHSTPTASYMPNDVSVLRGFPSTIDSKQAWHASGFADENSYMLHLSDEDKKELDDALKSFKGTTSADL